MSARATLHAALFGVAVVALGACIGIDEGAVSSLRALGIQVIASDGYLLRSSEGWRAVFPGVPLAERQEYRLGSHVVPATFLDLSAEADSRAYLLHVYDARALGPHEREELRALAERHVLETGRAVRPRVAREGDVTVHDNVVMESGGMTDHDVILRTCVLGGFVIEAAVIVAHGAGDPSDARQFFASIGLRAQPPEVSR